MSRPDPKIVFHAQYTRVTGEDANVVVSFNGADQGELRTRLTQVHEVVQAHVKKTHNDKVLNLTDEIREKAERVKGEIARAERARLADLGVLPRALVDGVPARDPKEANGGAGPAGTADLRADS